MLLPLLLSLLPLRLVYWEAPGDGNRSAPPPRVPSDAATPPRLPPSPPARQPRRRQPRPARAQKPPSATFCSFHTAIIGPSFFLSFVGTDIQILPS